MAADNNWPAGALHVIDPAGAGSVAHGFMFDSEGHRHGVNWSVTETKSGYEFSHWTFELTWSSPESQEWFPGAELALQQQSRNSYVELTGCYYNPDEFPNLAFGYVTATAHFVKKDDPEKMRTVVIEVGLEGVDDEDDIVVTSIDISPDGEASMEGKVGTTVHFDLLCKDQFVENLDNVRWVFDGWYRDGSDGVRLTTKLTYGLDIVVADGLADDYQHGGVYVAVFRRRSGTGLILYGSKSGKILYGKKGKILYDA